MKENLNMIQPDLEKLDPQKKRIQSELAKTFFFFIGLVISSLNTLLAAYPSQNLNYLAAPHNGPIHGFAEQKHCDIANTGTQKIQHVPRKGCTPTDSWQREFATWRT